MRLYLTALIMLTTMVAGAQIPRQTIRGTIRDEVTGAPVMLASVVIQNTDPLLGAVSDEQGRFVIKQVPVGRYDISVSFMGYQPVVITEVLVTSARETLLTVSMKEQTTALKEVVIKPKVNKESPLNTMAAVSARMLSVEEASRYAGGADDPARLASSFAGVSGNMVSNGIIVRGNAPKSFQWKMEGIEIPNPNHFADVYSFGGGGLTALSSQLLANSDFFTGAFPAEYSNALSGVFDIFMRTGNPSKHQRTLQAGAIGLDFAGEGPFSESRNASYLFNYRFSTLALLTPLLPEDAEGTTYQDISFKLNFPTKKAGTFAVWGIGLTDGSGAEAETDSTLWVYNQDKEQNDARQFMGAAGFSHTIPAGRNARIKTTLAATILGLKYETERMNDRLELQPQSLIKTRNTDFVLTSAVSSKLSGKHANKTGFTVTALNYNLLMHDAGDTGLPPVITVDEEGNSWLISAYTSSAFTLSDKVLLNIGLTGQHFTLNNRHTLEPRASVKWQFSESQSVALAYGLHSRLERLNYYFIKDSLGAEINRNLDFTSAHHLVLSYSLSINNSTVFRAEPYYQLLFRLPVEPDGRLSFLNLTDQWFYNAQLLNEGEGKNYGIDLTLEKYLKNGNYYMATASVFESEYKTTGDVWHNTRFNINYVINLLGGKEWYTGEENKNVFGVNGRITLQGGERYIPVDQEASARNRSVVYDWSRPYTGQLNAALLAHLTVSYRINNQRASHEIALKILNATNYKDFYGFRYNYKTNTVDQNREAVMIPNISYKVEF